MYENICVYMYKKEEFGDSALVVIGLHACLHAFTRGFGAKTIFSMCSYMRAYVYVCIVCVCMVDCPPDPMYVCMYVCLYVCMYVCIYARVILWIQSVHYIQVFG